MLLKRTVPWLIFIAIVFIVFGWKIWQRQSLPPSLRHDQPVAEVKGPAVILFRGDNDPGCQIIYQMVDEAATHHGQQIHFVRTDWSDDNPLIKKYQIRFLPSVVFVNNQDKEIERIVGESPAVQQKLKQTLADVDKLLLQ